MWQCALHGTRFRQSEAKNFLSKSTHKPIRNDHAEQKQIKEKLDLVNVNTIGLETMEECRILQM